MWINEDIQDLFGAGLRPLSGTLDGSLRVEIPSGYQGTARTIHWMQELVELGRRNKNIRPYVGRAIANCPQKDYYCYAKSIYEWVKRELKYVFDPHDVEMVENPEYILSTSKIGDCDSLAVVLAAMYEQIDLPARFVTIKADPNNPKEFSHVWTEVQVNGKWYGADPTVKGKWFGWQPPAKYTRTLWPAVPSRRNSYRDDKLEGLGMLRGASPIPNVTEFPWYDTPGSDWQIDVPIQSLSGLRGLDSVCSACLGLSGLGVAPESIPDSIWNFAAQQGVPREALEEAITQAPAGTPLAQLIATYLGASPTQIQALLSGQIDASAPSPELRVISPPGPASRVGTSYAGASASPVNWGNVALLAAAGGALFLLFGKKGKGRK